tara:strand:+ start:492 stop:629 length:138 start_codon:yes stop_codon:yes gene_type:complete
MWREGLCCCCGVYVFVTKAGGEWRVERERREKGREKEMEGGEWDR